MTNNFNFNLEHIPKELKLLLEIIKTEHDIDIHIKSLEWATDIDWNLFLELAMHHRLYPLLNTKLKKLNSLIPTDVYQVIHENYKKNTFLMLNLSAEIEQVSKLFANNHIHLLVLKGPVLAADLYGDISLRTSSDLDVLVPLDDLEKVENLLIETGYVKDDYFQTILSDWKWRHHHITFFHPKSNIKLEVHWRLNPGPGKEPSFNELWERKRISSFTSDSVSYLGREDLFLFLVSHGARHGWSRLRWLVDIHQIVKQKLDYPKLLQLLKKYQYFHVGGQALILTSQLLETSLGKEMKPLVSGIRPRQLAQEAVFYLENMVNLHTDPVPEDVARYHKRHLFSLMSNQQKLFFIMSFLHPYPEDAEALPLPKYLHFLYFPLRPFLWAWRKTRKHVLS
ncbi:nucleotidyltransferase domain-containing protein [Peribacillus sp. JNUCC 23]